MTTINVPLAPDFTTSGVYDDQTGAITLPGGATRAPLPEEQTLIDGTLATVAAGQAHVEQADNRELTEGQLRNALTEVTVWRARVRDAMTVGTPAASATAAEKAEWSRRVLLGTAQTPGVLALLARQLQLNGALLRQLLGQHDDVEPT